MTIRAFIAHAKGDADDRIAALKDDVTTVLERMAAGRKPVEVVIARDYYFANFSRCGSWEAYARDVSQGVHYLTREPNFSLIVLADERIGAATQAIVKHALAVAKLVVLWESGGFVKIVDVEQVSRDMKNGWLARRAP